MTAAADRSWATLSDDSVYRYQLGRRWDHGPCDVWIMLNPSTADAEHDDPTIRRCMGFSHRWGAGSLIVVNLFALRSTDPTGLARHPDPVGPENDNHIGLVAAGAQRHGGRVIAAWGAHPIAAPRAQVVRHLVRQQAGMVCLGATKAGAPRHPLYVRGDTDLRPWGAA